MKINVIASSSKGNCIVVDGGCSKIMLDAGIPYREIRKHVKVSELSGVLITHSHRDHCYAVDDLLKRGVPVYTSAGEWAAMAISPGFWANAFIVRHKQLAIVGHYQVVPFSVQHDTPEPMGFLMHSKTANKRLVYIVDSAIVEYDFKGVTHFLLEANHYEKGIENANLDESAKRRIRENHMSFESLKTFLSTTDLSKAEQIHLLHLSRGNSNEKKFMDDIQAMTGVPVYVS